MPVPQAVTDVIAKINDATNAVAAKIADLKTQISTSMTQADVDNVVGQLTGIETHLEAMASDPANPVPPSP